MSKIPIILDTDIGGDIDDTWALIMALKRDELDIKLISIVGVNTFYQAKLVAKLLQIAGREDIPVAYNPTKNKGSGPQGKWVEDFSLDDYQGVLYKDTSLAIKEVVEDTPEKIKIVSIGVATNTARAIEEFPDIISQLEFIGMHGSVFKGYGGSDEPCAEANVRYDPSSLSCVFAADFRKTITPLDTCGLVQLKGDNYQKIRNSKDPLLQALMENYHYWWENCDWNKQTQDLDVESSTLFDNVAVYLAYSEELLKIKDLPLRVTDDGFTVINENGHLVRTAVDWVSLDDFHKHLTESLLKEI